MQYAIIIAPNYIDDVERLQNLINEVRRTRGVNSLDLEIVESGLLLARISTPEAVSEVAKIEGVTSVKQMGLKRALIPPA